MGKVLFYSLIALLGVGVLRVIPAKLEKRHAQLAAWGFTVLYLLMNVYYTFLSRVDVSEQSLQETVKKYVEYTLEHPEETNAVERGFASVLQVLLVFSPESYLLGCALNILLYVPLGYLLLCSFRSLRSRWPEAVVVGFAASCLTESLQWCTGLGMADAMDLVCNTAGTVLGVMAYRRWLAGRWHSVGWIPR